MIAPSEKHLQDYLWEHPDVLNDPELYYDEFHLFKREAVLPSGRADFLAAYIDEGICVIETKKDKIAARSIAQTLRYIGDLETIWKYSIGGLPDPDPLHPSYAREPKISGVLIGYSIDDDLLISALSAGISVYLYQFDGRDYVLKQQFTESTQDDCLDFAHGYLGDACRKAYMNYLRAEFGSAAVSQMKSSGITPQAFRNLLDHHDIGDIPF